MTTSLELQAIRKHYGAVAALGGVDLSVAPGSRTAIVGPSGSGKTTLLRIIAGFEAPDAGRVTLGGRQLADGPEAVPAHERGIGYVPQDGALFPHLTIEGNVGFGLPRNTPKRAERIAELMTWSRWTAPCWRAARTSSRAASSSAWRWRARWRSGHG